VIGILGGVMNYLVNLGPNLPADAKGWGVVMVSAFLAALGIGAKDANVSNSQNPGPAAPVDPAVK
jgi:hypothetical protein